MPEVLLVKNMVCRCYLLAVEDVLKKSAIPFNKVFTGKIHLSEKLSQKQTDILNSSLGSIGLELIDNRMSGMIDKIKQLVIKKARNEAEGKENKTKLSIYLS